MNQPEEPRPPTPNTEKPLPGVTDHRRSNREPQPTDLLTPEQLAIVAEFPDAADATCCRLIDNSSGFSGAAVWRIETPTAEFALRRVPAGQPPPPRRAWLHRFLRFIRARGLEFIAAPLTTSYGATFVERGGFSWELAPWLPGEADFHVHPSRERLAAAMAALAHFHRTAAGFPNSTLAGPAGLPVWTPSRSSSSNPTAVGSSPGLADRLQLLQRLVAGEADEMRQAVEPSLKAAGKGGYPHFGRSDPGDSGSETVRAQLAPRAARLMELFDRLAKAAMERLRKDGSASVPLQPCLRDVWHNHVLFAGDKVTGLIDYDAIRIDSVAGDLARLLGSFVEDDRSSWEFALVEYARVRPLSATELGLVEVFDVSSIAISGTQWVRWLYLDRLIFPNAAAIAERMDHWIRRGERFLGDNSATSIGPRWE
jgi:Ser/Thr protein kinase RdoA (MazF antagonist)